MAEHGVLGDGSIPEAKAAIGGVQLRPESELREGLDAYLLARGEGAVPSPHRSRADGRRDRRAEPLVDPRRELSLHWAFAHKTSRFER